MVIPDQRTLRRLLDYDPEAGILTWKHRPEARKEWNTRWAGKPAFTAKDKRGYRVGRLNGHSPKAHRIIWKWMTGGEPPEIDHRDGDPSNNRWANLRACSHAENGRNVKLNSRNTSGVCGVYWARLERKWRAQIGYNRKVRVIGSFATFDDAIAARLAAQRELGFTDRHGT